MYHFKFGKTAIFTSLVSPLSFMSYDHMTKIILGKVEQKRNPKSRDRLWLHPNACFSVFILQDSLSGDSLSPFLWSLRTLYIISNAESSSFNLMIPDQKNTLWLGPLRIPYWISYALPHMGRVFFYWRVLVSSATYDIRELWPQRETVWPVINWFPPKLPLCV